MPPDSLRRPGLFPIALDRVLEYLLGNPRLQPTTDEYNHAACFGGFIAGSTAELRKPLAAACVIDGIPPAFGQWLEAIVYNNNTEAPSTTASGSVWLFSASTRMHHRDTFALDVVRERYHRPGTTKNPGSPEISELLEP
eukprot:jgi/Tetstr1/437753/TSEL_026407.t1